MTVKLLTEHRSDVLRLKGCCTGSSEFTLVKMPHCWKSHVMAHMHFNKVYSNSSFIRLMEFSIKFDTFKSGWSIVYCFEEIGFLIS